MPDFNIDDAKARLLKEKIISEVEEIMNYYGNFREAIEIKLDSVILHIILDN